MTFIGVLNVSFPSCCSYFSLFRVPLSSYTYFLFPVPQSLNSPFLSFIISLFYPFSFFLPCGWKLF
jgi:hypothetical protein